MPVKPIPLPVQFEDLEDRRVLVYTDAVPSCLAEGDTIDEAPENVEDVARVLLEVLEEDGGPLPLGMLDYEERGFEGQVEARHRA